jgi:uracil-DNA glycosylase
MALNIVEQLDSDWARHFEQEFAEDYMVKLREFLNHELSGGQVVYPPKEQWFNAFTFTPLKKIKVVIVGQDPYHGEGQAHGLSFSVPQGIKIPPSLRNIYKELNRDLAMDIPTSGNLESWAKQGVLLLNASLTVRAGEANSHSKQGWLNFTNSCIEYINQECEGVVFLAWGRFAHNVCAQIDTQKHCVIKTSHPSPLGASKTGKDFTAFIGSGCFTLANEYLTEHNQTAIDWQPA